MKFFDSEITKNYMIFFASVRFFAEIVLISTCKGLAIVYLSLMELKEDWFMTVESSFLTPFSFL